MGFDYPRTLIEFELPDFKLFRSRRLYRMGYNAPTQQSILINMYTVSRENSLSSGRGLG